MLGFTRTRTSRTFFESTMGRPIHCACLKRHQLKPLGFEAAGLQWTGPTVRLLTQKKTRHSRVAPTAPIPRQDSNHSGTMWNTGTEVHRRSKVTSVVARRNPALSTVASMSPSQRSFLCGRRRTWDPVCRCGRPLTPWHQLFQYLFI